MLCVYLMCCMQLRGRAAAEQAELTAHKEGREPPVLLKPEETVGRQSGTCVSICVSLFLSLSLCVCVGVFSLSLACARTAYLPFASWGLLLLSMCP